MNQNPRKTLPLGDFKPSDQWQTHINSIFYGILGPEIHNHFQTYVSLDHRLAHTLAGKYFQQVKDQPPSPSAGFPKPVVMRGGGDMSGNAPGMETLADGKKSE